MNMRCILDDDGTSPEVDTCLRNADHFLDRYLRHIRENTLNDFDRCRSELHYMNLITLQEDHLFLTGP